MLFYWNSNLLPSCKSHVFCAFTLPIFQRFSSLFESLQVQGLTLEASRQFALKLASRYDFYILRLDWTYSYFFCPFSISYSKESLFSFFRKCFCSPAARPCFLLSESYGWLRRFNAIIFLQLFFLCLYLHWNQLGC